MTSSQREKEIRARIVDLALRADLSTRQKFKRIGSRYHPLLQQYLDVMEDAKIAPVHVAPSVYIPEKRLLRPQTQMGHSNKPLPSGLDDTTGSMTPMYVDRSLHVPIKLWHCARGGVAWSLRDNGQDIFYLDKTTKQPMRFVSAQAALLCVQKLLMKRSAE